MSFYSWSRFSVCLWPAYFVVSSAMGSQELLFMNSEKQSFSSLHPGRLWTICQLWNPFQIFQIKRWSIFVRVGEEIFFLALSLLHRYSCTCITSICVTAFHVNGFPPTKHQDYHFRMLILSLWRHTFRQFLYFIFSYRTCPWLWSAAISTVFVILTKCRMKRPRWARNETIFIVTLWFVRHVDT